MANTIRIIIGFIMLVISIASIWMSILFTRGKLWEYFTNLQSLLDFTTLVILPGLAAWLLLFPKSNKHALVGMVISFALVLYVIANQALRSYSLTGQF